MVGKGTIMMVNSYISSQLQLGKKSCIIEQSVYGYPYDIEELMHIIRIRWPKIVFSKTIINSEIVIFAEWAYDINADIVYTRNDLEQIYLEGENRKKIEHKQKLDYFVSEIVSKVLDDSANGCVERNILIPFEEESFEYIKDRLSNIFTDMDISFVNNDSYKTRFLVLNWDWRTLPKDI